jgi:uncharacterized protein YdaU (DUF1376 family)
MNYYPHHIGDFNNATRHLTRVERSVYRDLLDLYYDTEQSLTLDIKGLCRKILAHSGEEATAVEQVLNEFFTKTEAGWYHDRCEVEIAEYRRSISGKSAAGKASAAKRAAEKAERLEKLNACSTGVEQPLNSVDSSVQLTSNQEPVTKNHKTRVPASAPDLFPGVDVRIVADFKALRSKKKAPVTETAIAGIKREADAAGLSLEDALRICCERGWAGFEAKWITEAAQKASGAWWATDATVTAKGQELNMHPLPGEQMQAFKGRIQAAIDNGGVPVVPRLSRVVDPVVVEPAASGPSPSDRAAMLAAAGLKPGARA